MSNNQPTYKSIFALALPALIAGIVEPVLSLTDLAIVGQIDYEALGANSDNQSTIAAVGLAGSLLSALIWVFAQTKSAISAIVSRALGANKLDEMRTLIPQLLIFNISVGIIATVSTYFLSEWIFSTLLSAKGLILSDATIYYNIRCFGFPLTLITFSLFGVFRGIQNTVWAMIISSIGGALNILLDLIFVLGWGGLNEPMGIEGAAYASVISQAVMFVLAVYFLFKKAPVKIEFSKIIHPQFRALIILSANLMVRTITLNIALILTHKFANIYGKPVAATHSVLMNLWLFSAFFLDAFATSTNAMAGKFLGANDSIGQKRNLIRNMGLAISTSLLLALVFIIFHKPIFSIFIQDPEVYAVYPLALPFFIICLPFNAVAFTFDGLYKGMGEGVFLRNLLLISTIFGFIPALLLGHFYSPGIEIIWFSIIIWMVFRGVIPWLKFRTNT